MEGSDEIDGLGAACQLRERLESEGKHLVFTNGCFDVLHVGHARYLKEARALGDGLVIGLNDDASVRALKGAGRPVNSAADRRELLLALECVDEVAVFGGERATGLIDAIRPHVYAKGGDYTAESLNVEEKRALGRVGAEIQILSLVEGKSTSRTLAKLSGGREKSGKLRLAVLGSGKGSNLEAILEAIDRGALDADPVVVISDVEDSGVMRIAKERGIEAVFVDAGSSGGSIGDPALKEIRDRMKALAVDLVVLAGYMRVLREPLLGEWEGRIVNIHPSLLPKHRGLEAWRQALAAGETETGCTVHLVSGELDGGFILGQRTVAIKKGDSERTLHARIQEAEHRLYPIELQKLGIKILASRCD